MNIEQSLNNNETVDKYGISVSCRIPVSLHKIIGDEAVLRNVSMAKQLTTLLLIGHKQSADQNAEINILIKEKENLQQQLQTLNKKLLEVEQELENYKKDEENLEPLRRNRDLLRKHEISSPVVTEKLVKEGFDFSYATRTFVDQGKQFFCVLDMCYSQDNNFTFIKSL